MGSVGFDIAGKSISAERLIAGQGTPESAWRDWPGLDRLPDCAAAALVPPGRRAVVLSPHPDDEVLGAGGLLATLAALGRTILVIGVTDGGASHPDSADWTPQTLGVARCAESAAGLHTLGVNSAALRLHFDDGALALQREKLVDALSERLRSIDVVFAPWRYDGHPDHEAVGEAAAAACARVGAKLVEMPIWMWHWASPDDPRVPWSVATRVALKPEALQHKQAAIACHKTQLSEDASTGASPVLAPWALDRWMRPFEVFFT